MTSSLVPTFSANGAAGSMGASPLSVGEEPKRKRRPRSVQPDWRTLLVWSAGEMEEALELARRIVDDECPSMHGNGMGHRITRHAEKKPTFT